MLETDDAARDSAGFVLPETGALIETADPLGPCVLLDAEGAVVAPAEETEVKLLISFVVHG
ncbi:hypothetical protein [Streptomyces sp. DSM 40750]|uniref:hypothetical protein n=1 Tax=Streptomyces sp. DSM 40750 TaxID=2801030 RepID=UPI00214C1AAE|nr:hypothetical protein [Streptomyces sp. DSM 40750]UUU18949.1 hypothetical protein JIX55_00500 [Streptomyces sp. DSM 40750]UUU27709.1 hypothetical protein JIX55_50250 [Streptomyces sp. DSM 40750]